MSNQDRKEQVNKDVTTYETGGKGHNDYGQEAQVQHTTKSYAEATEPQKKN